MEILTRDRHFESRGANPLLPWGSTTPPTNGSLGMGVAGVTISDHTALQLAAVWASVSIITDSIAALPIRQYRATGSKTATEMDPAQVVEEPWSEMTRRDFITQGTASLLLRGNLYGNIVSRGSNLYPEQVQLIHPDHARVRRNSSTGLIEVRYANTLISPDNVTRAMGLSMPEALVGLNPIECMRNVMGIARAQDLYGGAFFSNSARPDGVITVPGDLDPEQAKQMRDAWLAAHQGINASHLPAVLTGDAKFQAITMNPQDIQFLEQMQFSASLISGLIFRVPPHMIGMTDKETSWGCLPGDALVFTTDGPRPIAQVEPGEQVWSLGDKGMEPAKVIAHRMTGYKQLLTFHTRGRVVRATSNHHMIVRRWNCPGRGIKGQWETLHLDAADVEVGDYFVIPHGFGDGDRTDAPNGRHLTVGAMELCGLYTGDGSADKNRVEIAHEAVPDHMGHYSRVIREEFGVEPSTDARRTRFSSADARELLECGFTGTSLTKRVPHWVFRLAPELQLAYLRGYLDSDGSVQHGCIVYTSANRLLLEDVRHLCMSLGVPAGKVSRGRPGGTGEIRGRTHVSHDQWRLSLSSKHFNSQIGSNSPRKAARFVDASTARVLRYDEGYAPRIGGMPPVTAGWSASNCVFHKVTRIDSDGIEVPVYDIEVAGTHNFVADGVIVGNSGIEQMELGYVRNTLLNWLGKWEDLITSWLPPRQFVLFDLSQRLRGDTLQRWAAYQIARVVGAMNNAEVRQAEGLPPVTGNDALDAYDQPFNSSPMPASPGQGGDKAN